MDLLIRFIGIVTFVCMPTSSDCKAPELSSLGVYLPSAVSGANVCGKQNIMAHAAFIRVLATKPPTSSTNWTPTPCDTDSGRNCWLYQLNDEVVDIDGVTNGSGQPSFTLSTAADEVRWKNVAPLLKLSDHPEVFSVAYMTVKAGTVTFDYVGNMVAATLTLKNRATGTHIKATGKNGVRTLDLDAGVNFDILHMPPRVATHIPGKPVQGMPNDHDHFYLHFLLADPRPQTETLCKIPKTLTQTTKENVKKPESKNQTDTTLACSNSTYP
jgi:hypothetical protein